MAKVSIGVFWQEYGRQEIDLPENIDENNTAEVLEYIHSIFDDLPLPSGDYIPDSAEIDPESLTIIKGV